MLFRSQEGQVDYSMTSSYILNVWEESSMEDLPVIGIYCITERSSGKRYIGQSRNVHSRWWQHRDRFPPDTHGYEVLIECGVEELDDLEQSFITQLNTRWPTAS